MNMECTTFHSSNQNHEIPKYSFLLHFAFAARCLDLITVEGNFAWHGQVKPMGIKAQYRKLRKTNTNLEPSSGGR
jgi:hypothetical protein